MTVPSPPILDLSHGFPLGPLSQLWLLVLTSVIAILFEFLFPHDFHPSIVYIELPLFKLQCGTVL